MNTKPLYNIVMRNILQRITAEDIHLLPIPKSIICNLEVEEKILSIEKIKATINNEIEHIRELTEWCITKINEYETERLLLYISENQVANGYHFFVLLSQKMYELSDINEEAINNNRKLNKTYAKETTKGNINTELALDAFKTAIKFFKALKVIWQEYKKTISETEHLTSHNSTARLEFNNQTRY